MYKEIYTLYQKNITEKEYFNEELIYSRRKEKNDIHKLFEDLFKTITVPGITFLGSRTITDETLYENFVKKKHKTIEQSRLDLIEADFKLEMNGEEKTITTRVFFPKLIDDFFFILNGIRYYAIYQITDKNYYNIRNGIFLKTLLMPLGIRHVPSKLTAESGNEYVGKTYLLDFYTSKGISFRNLKNIFFYMYIKFGFEGAMEFLELNKCVRIVENLDDIQDHEEVFKVKKDFYVVVLDKEYLEDIDVLSIICTFINSLESIKRLTSISNVDFWKKKILTTPTSKLTKADKAMISLERILDERTKKNLREVSDEDKQDSYHILRYMMYNYNHIFNLDTVDLANRRLRLGEYLIYPLLAKFSDKSYCILNRRNVDIKGLESIFNSISPMFLIGKLIKNELLRYSNATNSMELFSVALRWSARGPQSLYSGKSNVLIKYRAIHDSYLGNVSLNASSSSDPGLSGTINPFCRNIDDMFFEINNESN
jgi:hypothetical protein